MEECLIHPHRVKMVLRNVQLVIQLNQSDEQLSHDASPNHQMLKFEKFLYGEVLDLEFLQFQPYQSDDYDCVHDLGLLVHDEQLVLVHGPQLFQHDLDEHQLLQL